VVRRISRTRVGIRSVKKALKIKEAFKMTVLDSSKEMIIGVIDIKQED
jgi:hypothetical protein